MVLGICLCICIYTQYVYVCVCLGMYIYVYVQYMYVNKKPSYQLSACVCRCGGRRLTWAGWLATPTSATVLCCMATAPSSTRLVALVNSSTRTGAAPLCWLPFARVIDEDIPFGYVYLVCSVLMKEAVEWVIISGLQKFGFNSDYCIHGFLLLYLSENLS